jgi:DNA-binding FadR family transcriptional regulator
MDAPDNHADQRGRNVTEIVAERIRVHIQTQGLTPGDRLGREADLAVAFGISRPTLREALRLLSSSHLIRASKGPGGGIFVAATPEEGIGKTVSDVVATMLETHSINYDDLIETRLLLEVPLAGLAAQRASDLDVGALSALIKELESDIGRLDEIDARIHSMIAVIGGNRLAAAFTGWVVDVAQPQLAAIVAPVVVEEVIVDQHRELARAISRGDPLNAERAMREHLVYLRDLVTTVLREGER